MPLRFVVLIVVLGASGPALADSRAAARELLDLELRQVRKQNQPAPKAKPSHSFGLDDRAPRPIICTTDFIGGVAMTHCP